MTAEMSDPSDGRREPDAARDQQGVAHDRLQRLWAPWRFGYVSGADDGDGGHERREPGADDNGESGGGDIGDGCPFCVLPARDPARDRESLVLYRGSGAYVILNAFPYNPGHLMVVPYVHERSIGAVDDDAADEMWVLARRAARILHDDLGAEGVNLGMNLGEVGGAGIAEHVHLHAVPRWGGDTNFISVVGATRVLPRALTEVWDALADADWT